MKRLGRIERGRFHVIVRQTVWEDGRRVKRPVLWIVLQSLDGHPVLFIYRPLLDYFAERSAMSYRWMKNAARSMGLLVDHTIAVASSESGPAGAGAATPRRFFRAFAKALAQGTVMIGANQRGEDPSGLYWEAMGKRQAGVLLSALTLHFRWMRDEPGAAVWVEAVTATSGEPPLQAIRLASELLIRRRNSLLGHLKGIERMPPHALPGVIKASGSATITPPAFPARFVGPFLYRGFLDRQGECGDEAGQLLAHLLATLGLRKSEGFHLYLSDVQFVGGAPWIFFHHPENGKVIDRSGQTITRSNYLQGFGLLPRNRDPGRNAAGWKGMADDEIGTPGYFLPIATLRQRVKQLLLRYIFEIRPAIMARRPRSLGDHPFLLVSSGRTATATGGEIGDPYTIAAFDHSWAQAIKSVGREAEDPILDKPVKSRGTTPHGMRHLYGRFLYTCGVEGRVIRSCMHHRSLDAYLAYTRLTPAEIDLIVTTAAAGRPHAEAFAEMKREFMSALQGSVHSYATG